MIFLHMIKKICTRAGLHVTSERCKALSHMYVDSLETLFYKILAKTDLE